MWLITLMLCIGLRMSLPVLLTDPKSPDHHHEFRDPAVILMFVIGVLPAFFLWAPRSAVYNAALALAIATTFALAAFGTMATSGKAELVQDKVFVIFTRGLFATVLLIPLSRLGSWWFILLAVIGISLFASRISVYLTCGGHPARYLRAIAGLVIASAAYNVFVQTSCVTPDTWNHWYHFLGQAGGCR